jgi:hypothetical protein
MEIINRGTASQTVKNIHKLYNNPFLLAPLITEFYSNFNRQPKDILLSYLIFPMVLYSESEEYLNRTDKRKSLITYNKTSSRIYGLPERIIEYKELTQLSIQYSVDSKFISVNQDLSISVKNKPNITDSTTLPIKSTSNLAKMFCKHDIVTIYKMLGIKKI